MPEHGTAKKLAMRAEWALSSLRDFKEYRRRRAAFKAETRDAPGKRIDQPVGHRTRHVYRIAGGKAFTTFQMDQRWKIVSRLYPEKVTSLLDIGCCRGWFVIRAAMEPTCERATGVDVVQGFIDAANDARRELNLDNAQFEYAFLDDIAGDAKRFRTPYQTIVLLNTYHYMYWGSGYSGKHWADHDYLLRTLAQICTDRIIFMSPLEVRDCPSDIAKRAAEHPEWATDFTTEKFLEVANRYFDVSLQSYLGVRPLYLMKKK
jgi:SAM-dependent methyltransferase